MKINDKITFSFIIRIICVYAENSLQIMKIKMKLFNKVEQCHPGENTSSLKDSQRSNTKTNVTSGCQSECLENLYKFKAFTERSS